MRSWRLASHQSRLIPISRRTTRNFSPLRVRIHLPPKVTRNGRNGSKANNGCEADAHIHFLPRLHEGSVGPLDALLSASVSRWSLRRFHADGRGRSTCRTPRTAFAAAAMVLGGFA